MPRTSRKVARVTKFLLAGVTVFCVSWIACVNEWHGGVHWRGRRDSDRGLSTMRTIVAYSEGKQAEMDRPSPVTCERLPAFPDIPHINRTWTPGSNEPESPWKHVAGTRVAVYSAYYDERASQHYVRILARFQGRNFSVDETLFCQTRILDPYEDSVEVVAAKPLEIWWHLWDSTSSEIETPLLLSCPLTEPLRGPSVVSLVTQPCDNPTNAFPLESSQGNYKYKRTFTICVKDMNFDKEVSQDLVEWIEINRILGVEMIDLYVDRINKAMEKVLLYYRDKGYVRLFHVPINDKPKRSLWQRRRDHIITYNDCLYRNIGESEFVVPLDIDEIVLPKVADTWYELVKRLTDRGWDPRKNSAILVRNVFFFDFMQEINKFNHSVHTNESDVYVKRDDVRIQDSNVDISKIKLIEDRITNGSRNVFRGGDKNLYNEYKTRCGKELPIPKLVRHIVSSAEVSPVGSYTKSLMVTKKVLTAFNHYPLASRGTNSFTGWPAPYREVQLNHYKESCNTKLMAECAQYEGLGRPDRAALRLRSKLTSALANTICTGINPT